GTSTRTSHSDLDRCACARSRSGLDAHRQHGEKAIKPALADIGCETSIPTICRMTRKRERLAQTPVEASSPQMTTSIAAEPRLSSLLGARFLVGTVLGTALVAVAIGVPTDVIPNPWFTRMIPANASNYFFWVASSLLTGALLATYLVPRRARERIAAASAGSSFLALLSVGCPVCNKLVIAILGVSGALNYFAPIQPLLGAVGLALAGLALALRLRGARRACALPDAPTRLSA
ncbi:MAG: hypothetical protein R2725_07560, partial [Solirubrobacterales bacterium]